MLYLEINDKQFRYYIIAFSSIIIIVANSFTNNTACLLTG